MGAREDVRLTDIKVLVYLIKSGPAYANAIAKKLHMYNPTVWKTLRRLEKRGYVRGKIEELPRAGIVKVFSITKEGWELYRKYVSELVVEDFIEDLIKNYPRERLVRAILSRDDIDELLNSLNNHRNLRP